MNLKQLLFAQSVGETCSFSQAAQRCCVTQPTLSNAIAQLEDELGGKLFTRTTRTVELTKFGEYLLPFIRAVLDDKNELQKAAESYHNPEYKLLRIGLSPLIDMKLLTQVLIPYRQAHPKINIFFKECLLDDLNQRLTHEQIDFAVVPTSVMSEPSQFFYAEHLYYLPQESDMTQQKIFQYRINELPDTQIILTGGGCGLNAYVEQIFKQEHVTLNAYPGQALSYKVIEEWASLGIGAGILPKAKISPDNKMARPLLLNNGQMARFHYHWIWQKEIVKRQDMTDFIDYVMNTIPALIKGEQQLVAA